MRWMLYSGIGAVFLLGGAAGGMIGMTAERERLKRMEAGPPAMLMESVSRRLERELDLDEEQTRKVRAIYAEARPEVVEVEMEHRRKMHDIMRAAHAKVETVLRPEQSRAFADLQRRVEHRLRMREAGGPGGGGKGKGGGWKGPPPPEWRGGGGPGGPPRGGWRHGREGKEEDHERSGGPPPEPPAERAAPVPPPEDGAAPEAPGL